MLAGYIPTHMLVLEGMVFRSNFARNFARILVQKMMDLGNLNETRHDNLHDYHEHNHCVYSDIHQHLQKQTQT
jgi:hypothetical protein